jgi:hypothetical protein
MIAHSLIRPSVCFTKVKKESIKLKKKVRNLKLKKKLYHANERGRVLMFVRAAGSMKCRTGKSYLSFTVDGIKALTIRFEQITACESERLHLEAPFSPTLKPPISLSLLIVLH